MPDSEAQMQKGMSPLGVRMSYHLITHMMQIIDLTVTVSALFSFLSSLLISSLLLPPSPLSKITSGRKNKHWKTLSCFGIHVCKEGLFPLLSSSRLKGAGAPVWRQTSSLWNFSQFSSQLAMPVCFQTKDFRLYLALIETSHSARDKREKMCFEIEPLGRQRNQHANATRKWIQDEAWGSNLGANRSLPAQGPSKAIVKTSGEFGPVFVKGRRWKLDVEAILKINYNGIDCFREVTLVCQRLGRLFTKMTLQWTMENFLLISHLGNSRRAECAAPCVFLTFPRVCAGAVLVCWARTWFVLSRDWISDVRV